MNRVQCTMVVLRPRSAYLCCRPSHPSSASSYPLSLSHLLPAPPRPRHRRTVCARSSFSSSTASLRAAASGPAPPFLFLVGGPCAGKGTQSRLLVEEFGGDVRGASDGTVVEPAILTRLSQQHPPVRSEGQQGRVALVHVSIGALLRQEMQQSTLTSGPPPTTQIPPPSPPLFGSAELVVFPVSHRLFPCPLLRWLSVSV